MFSILERKREREKEMNKCQKSERLFPCEIVESIFNRLKIKKFAIINRELIVIIISHIIIVTIFSHFCLITSFNGNCPNYPILIA